MVDLFTRDGARKSVEPLGRKLRAAVTQRVGLKLTALFFAFLIWFLLSAEEPTEELRTVRLSLVTDTLVNLTTPLPTVRALVAGPRRELARLDGDPPVVRRVIDADVADVDTIEIRAADVDVGAANVRVRDVQPRHIPLRFAVRAERMVPVASALEIVPDTGVALLAAPTIQPSTVRVSGPRERVRAVDSLFTVRGQIVVRDTLSTLVLIDTTGLGVTVDPREVRVMVPAVRVMLPDTGASAADTVPTARPTPR